MSVRLFRRGPRSAVACVVCGEQLPPTMTIEITQLGPRHLYCGQPASDSPTDSPTNQPAHTPGPWRVELQDDIDLDGNGYTWAVKAEKHNGYVQNPAYANSEANARLIAAAPALLEAAQAMYELHKDGVSHQLQFHQRAAAIVVLRAAITDATGKEK